MSETCDDCGYEPQNSSASVRRTVAECDRCGTLCDKCLVERAVAVGLMEEPEQVRDSCGAAGFIQECETTGRKLCPECFEQAE